MQSYKTWPWSYHEQLKNGHFPWRTGGNFSKIKDDQLNGPQKPPKKEREKRKGRKKNKKEKQWKAIRGYNSLKIAFW